MSAAHFLIDWHLPNQPIRITSVACFSSMQIFHAWEKCRLADLKYSFCLLIKMHLVSGQQLAEGFNSAIHSLSVNKANLEKAYFPTIRPWNNEKGSKIDPSLRRRQIIHENNHVRNKRFQLPVFPTANQILWHCSNSQSALRPKSGHNEHKLVIVCIRPNFSGSR